jgi:exonuclease VII large subunit
VDVTIADLVADVRAAAPTAAAEMAVPDVAVLRGEFEAYAARLTRATRGHVALAGERVSALFNRAVLRQPLDQVRRREQVLDELVHRTYRHLLDRVRAQRTVLDGLEPIVQRIAPHALLLNRTVLLGDVEQRLDRAASRRFLAAQRTFEAVVRRLAHASPETQLPRLIERLYRVARTLNTSTRHRVSLEAQHVRRQEERLIAMGHRSVLSRGFSITRTKKGAEIVRTVKQLSDRQRVVTEVADGEFESEVVNLKQLELFD